MATLFRLIAFTSARVLIFYNMLTELNELVDIAALMAETTQRSVGFRAPER